MNDMELEILKNSMETYLNFANAPMIEESKRQFFIGAASALNDFCCRIGAGEKIADLSDRLSKNE